MSKVAELIARSKAAQKQFEHATQEQANAAAKAILKVIYDNAEMFGPMAAEETKIGDPQHKVAKCRNKSALIWQAIKDRPSVDIINRIPEKNMIEVAKPMGVVASVVPSTNPVVTPMSNAAFALKTRNSIIFSPHPRAVECTKLVVKLFREELAKLGFPEDLVLGLEQGTIEDSAELMAAADVIVATGGMDMVRAAYSSGKPALGVGAGNVQVIIDTDADMADAVGKIIVGRSFDNGLICLGEQSIFVHESQMDLFMEEMAKQGAFFVEDGDILREGLYPGGGRINNAVLGRNALEVAAALGLEVPADTRVLFAKAKGVGAEDVLCREKLCPVLVVDTYTTFEEGVAKMITNLEHEGIGHSVGVHSNTQEHIEYAGIMCPVSRVIINQPTGTTGGGSPTNGFPATTTLGCGSWGNNSFSGNFDFIHLMNISRIGAPLAESYLPDNELAWK